MEFAPYREVRKNSCKNDGTDPVVVVEGLEAGFPVAAADEAIVIRHERGRTGETR